MLLVNQKYMVYTVLFYCNTSDLQKKYLKFDEGHSANLRLKANLWNFKNESMQCLHSPVIIAGLGDLENPSFLTSPNQL